jgi:hypothetical protein
VIITFFFIHITTIVTIVSRTTLCRVASGHYRKWASGRK